MYIRFVISRQDVESQSLQGVVQAVLELRNTGQLQTHEEEWLTRELKWLNMHLKSPDCLRQPGNHRAVCWFHPRAKRPIEKIRSIAVILQEKGIPVKMLKTVDPGEVIYSDGWQVVAKPSRRARRPRKPAGRASFRNDLSSGAARK